MKKLMFLCPLVIWVSYSLAQDGEEEWTTYYAEGSGFQISVPDDWAAGFAETKSLGIYGASLTAFKSITDDRSMIVVLISNNYKPKKLKEFTPPIEEDLKWWKKRSEKEAKKNGDDAYQWIDQSIETFPNEEVKMAWNEYIHTFVTESGQKTVSRTREVFLYLRGTMKFGSARYRVKINFISPVEDWDNAWKDFESILKSFAPYKA